VTTGLKPYPAYKDSGVPWLGHVPQHWRVQRLRQIGLLLKGVGGTKEDAVERGVPCIRYGDLYTSDRYFIRRPRGFLPPERTASYTPVRHGDVLFAASGETLDEIGKSAVVLLSQPTRCGGDIIVLRPRIPVFAPFMGYATDCRAAVIQKATMGRGTTVKHIYPDQLKELALALPPTDEQVGIVRYLDHINRRVDRYIRAKQKLIALLNEQKQAIIHRAVTRGLDPTVRLKPSGVEWLREIPESWHVTRIKRLAKSGPKTFTDGDWIELPFITADGVRLIQTGNVGIGEFREKGFRYVSEGTFRLLGCTEVRPNDVLICRLDGPVGRACLAPDLGVRAITSVDNTILKTRRDIDPRYVVYCLSSRSWLHWLQALCRAGGGFRYRVSRSTLGTLLVPRPPFSEQRAIADHLDSRLEAFRGALRLTETEVQRVREYRTRILTDVVTGKLDVREAAARLAQDEPGEPDAFETDEIQDDTGGQGGADAESDSETAEASN